MKKRLILILLTILNFYLYSDDWISGKKHFFDISLLGGFSTSNYGYFGGNFGISLGYQYGFIEGFAFGGGITLIGAITYDFNYNEQTPTMFGSIRFENNGGAVMLLFMIGDFHNNKVLFLFDIGAGWLFATKIGFCIKGFVFKVGYHSTFFFYYHNILLEFGYKIGW